jgi:hypothetical protein
MGRAARRAATGRLLFMRAVPPNGLERWPKHGPLARTVPSIAHGFSGCAVLGLGQISRAACWPSPDLQD